MSDTLCLPASAVGTDHHHHHDRHNGDAGDGRDDASLLLQSPEEGISAVDPIAVIEAVALGRSQRELKHDADRRAAARQPTANIIFETLVA